MIAAEDDRQFPSLKDFLHLLAEVFARVAYLAQVFKGLARFGLVLRALDAQVSEVAHFVAKLRHALVEAGHAHGSRADVYAFQPAAES
jgi:hypothetical protein